ncbi:MAG: hypothetical protein PVI92_02370 [Chromatiales bacterium]|jgi:hypothetical protein
MKRSSLFCALVMSANVATAADFQRIQSINTTDQAQAYASESGSQESESASTVEGYSAPDLSAYDVDSNLSLQAQACTRWWINGHHKYKWKNYLFAGYNKLTASSDTTYGDANGTCGIPLTVDVLKVRGNTVRISNMPAYVKKTAYNTSHVEDSGKTKWVGNGGNACGAIVDHIATKNGVTWSTTTKSGCGK